MKYLKKFEQKNYSTDMNIIYNEIKELFYIIEDEGYRVEFENLVSEKGKLLDTFDLTATISFFRLKNIDKSNYEIYDFVEEFSDRVDEICKKYGYMVSYYGNHGLDITAKY